MSSATTWLTSLICALYYSFIHFQLTRSLRYSEVACHRRISPSTSRLSLWLSPNSPADRVLMWTSDTLKMVSAICLAYWRMFQFQRWVIIQSLCNSGIEFFLEILILWFSFGNTFILQGVMRFVKSFVHTIHPRECQKSLKKISFSKIKVNKLHCGENVSFERSPSRFPSTEVGITT